MGNGGVPIAKHVIGHWPLFIYLNPSLYKMDILDNFM